MLRTALTLPRSFLKSAILRNVCSHEHSAAEKNMAELLRKGIEGCTDVHVHDVSNGCGSMFDVVVEATSFKGKSKVAQHKIVTGILKEQIKEMHGLTIKTKAA